MDFSQNEALRELAALTRKILADRVTQERLREVEAGGDRFDPALWADLASSGVLAAALAEEDGDDPRAPAVIARRLGGRWMLTGIKTAVPAGPRADLILVPAATPSGVAVFLV